MYKFHYKSISLIVMLIFFFANSSSAHCDSMNGPVIKASKKALETGNLNHVLAWVKADDEKEIREMFEKVNKVRTLSSVAKELADMYFFETVVRVHRMGEGVGYTGLIPEGVKPAEGIEAADMAIEKGSTNNLLAHLDKKHHAKVKELFGNLESKKNYQVDDVASGREYVESYVVFIHYVESLFNGEEPKEQKHLHDH